MRPPTCARSLSLKQQLPQRRNLSAVAATGAIESARLRSCCSNQQLAAFAVVHVAARQHLYLLAAVTRSSLTPNAAATLLHSTLPRFPCTHLVTMHGLRANDALVVAKQSPAPRSEMAAVARANTGDEGGGTTAVDATQPLNDVRPTSGEMAVNDNHDEPQRCN